MRGWVRAEAWTESPDELLGYRDVWLARPDGRAEPAQLVEGRRHGRGLALRFEGIADRSAAAGLTGAELQVPRAALPPLAPGQYYRVDLLGCEVVNLQGESLGTVDHFVDTPANAVMVLRGEQERWLPLVPRYLRQVDLAARRLVVDWDSDF